MPLSLSSSIGTLSINSLVATYTATAHGSGGLFYIKYTKGAEDGIRIALSYGSKHHSVADRFQHISVNLATRIIAPTSYVFTLSGNYRVPITWTCEEKNLTFTFSQYGAIAATGSVDVDFREAE
jgi:hypothetical protein